MASNDLLTQLRLLLAKHPEVRVAMLFGSEARGTARHDSDIDLAVDAPEADLLSIDADISAALDREVDIITLDDAVLTIPMMEHLIHDGIIVYERSRGDGALLRSGMLATLETDRPWFSRMNDAWLARVAARGIARG
ncbi:MAG: nucleotidyltransferase domain-containing protein [Byssovorax sp.]